jgi:acyl-coenzyme A thioesterase PaaI-like protein
VCGQAIMAANDTVASLAMLAADRPMKGIADQNPQFLRPAIDHDLRVTTTVLRSGSSIAYAETRVTFEGTEDLVAHATSEFIFSPSDPPISAPMRGAFD